MVSASTLPHTLKALERVTLAQKCFFPSSREVALTPSYILTIYPRITSQTHNLCCSQFSHQCDGINILHSEEPPQILNTYTPPQIYKHTHTLAITGISIRVYMYVCVCCIYIHTYVRILFSTITSPTLKPNSTKARGYSN